VRVRAREVMCVHEVVCRASLYLRIACPATGYTLPSPSHLPLSLPRFIVVVVVFFLLLLFLFLLLLLILSLLSLVSYIVQGGAIPPSIS
jgi:hypothetical protein